jgi:hypothetical protein
MDLMNDVAPRPFAFVLAVRDMTATAAYFRDALGFDLQWDDASDWRLLSRGQVKVMIRRCPAVTRAGELGDHRYFGYWHVDDVDTSHSELFRRGAIIRAQPEHKPYGQRGMIVATPDGHRMVICQTLPQAQD